MSAADLDLRGVATIRRLPHARAIDAALIALSRATDHSLAWFAAAAVGAAVDHRRRTCWLMAVARMVAVEAAVRVIKRGPRRRRPSIAGYPPLAPATSPLSFPSSHTAAAVAALSVFEGLLPIGLLRGVAGITAFSRLYLGLHFPSDVLAGALVGHACARLTLTWPHARRCPASAWRMGPEARPLRSPREAAAG